MKNRSFPNNANETFLSIASYILNNAPRGMLPRSQKEALTAFGGEFRSYYLTLEFERGSRVGVELRVELAPNWDRQIEAENGDLMMNFLTKVEVSMPGYGGSDPALAMLRAALLNDVALFATELKAAFSGEYYQLVNTKAEREEQAKAQQRARLERALLLLCRSHARGVRPVIASHELPDELAALLGTEPIELADGAKRYQVAAHSGGAVEMVKLRTEEKKD